tara:strand:+ start:901 stop:1116 length:216 start_codon:yes stop_codon:yes gene_type:complete
LKKVKLGSGTQSSKVKKYWVFAPEYRNMNKYERDRKLASVGSYNGNCWWIKEYLTMYPNRILDKSRKKFEM